MINRLSELLLIYFLSIDKLINCLLYLQIYIKHLGTVIPFFISTSVDADTQISVISKYWLNLLPRLLLLLS